MRLISRCANLFVSAITGLTELLLCWRGTGLGFLAIAALFTSSTWLRPPLGPDLRGIHLPLNILPWARTPAEDIMAVPRHFRFDSVGAVLLLLIAVSAVVIVWRPKLLSICAGVILAVTIAGMGTAIINHPALIEMLDGEIVQREQLGTVLRHESEFALAGNSPLRTAPLRMPKTDNSPEVEEFPAGSLMRGWTYMMYGTWLVITAMFVLLLNVRGGWDRRLGVLGLWTCGGLVFGGLLCMPRLIAEHFWTRAQEYERRGDLDVAQSNLTRAISIFPEFEDLGRTWYLQGKMDFRRNQPTLERLYFTSTQLAYHKDRARALAELEQLLAAGGDAHAAVRSLAGLMYADSARMYLANGLVSASSGAFRTSLSFAPYRIDSALGLGIVLTMTDRQRPKLAEAQLRPLISRVGDRALRADLLERLANVFFQAGELTTARKYYQESLDMFCQPKYVNIPAQEGMLGM